jgi:3-phosphoshikimate 1-carboxyvinyltransferase
MRFLTTFFASTEGEKILTGSHRMKERPIGNLVEALKKLGAEINYLEKEGFPPLIIKGKQLNGGKVSIDSSISSQFISSLLLSAPTFKNGLELELENKAISSSYIDLTLKLMEQMSVVVEKHKNYLKVLPQKYNPCNIKVEGDWSGVSYWYETVAFSPDADIFIYDLKKNSLQGDSRCAEIFKYFGIETEFKSDGIRIFNNGKAPARFDFNFLENPDLTQTMAVTCVMLNIPFCFTGTQSLRIKETDRIAALQNELKKFGAELKYKEGGILEWDGILKGHAKKLTISTYQDHRMALAFAPVSILGKEIEIENPGVVSKSYPGFWNDLKKMGFEIK